MIIKMNSTLLIELKRIWTHYKIYADSAIEAGCIPAPFGAVHEEKIVIDLIKEYHQRALLSTSMEEQ